ncbi:hypothetical protein [Psychromonas antarctica]|uniref:hypothetical protein n=1 Tax=Psychromonas antarctica TaxID=67573 RepID=UPI001EE924CF|nr:hypothetical protein [Psychromonas antarctica]MCG6202774.1 hypothetical protein [Psychromonas antarctica]
MIDFYDLGPVNLFDGDITPKNAPLLFDIKDQSISVSLQDLIPLHKLTSDVGQPNLNAEDIASALSFDITKLGPVKIFNGSKKGLKLHYYVASGLLCVFSLGEYQSGRFLCIYEAAIKL